MEAELENFRYRNIGEIGQQLSGKPLGFNLVVKIAAVDAGDFVQRLVNRVYAKKYGAGKCWVLYQKLDHLPGRN